MAIAIPMLTIAGGAFAARADAWHQDGTASYYGKHWTGLRTSSGEVFDPRKLTAAHPTLPLGTRVLVTSEDTGESVVVTINDRQPPHGRRILDLSPAAAARLHMMGRGVAEVEITEAGPRDVADDQEVAELPDDAPELPPARVIRTAHHAAHHHAHRARV